METLSETLATENQHKALQLLDFPNDDNNNAFKPFENSSQIPATPLKINQPLQTSVDRCSSTSSFTSIKNNFFKALSCSPSTGIIILLIIYPTALNIYSFHF